LADYRNTSISLLARVQALLPEDWRGPAGRRFRKTLNAISSTLEQAGAPPSELPTKIAALAVDKAEGYAQKEKAAAMKDFSEAEERRIDTQLKTRSLESKIRKEEAEARLAEIAVFNAELDLVKRLRETGVMLQENGPGRYTILSAPTNWDFAKVSDRVVRQALDAGDEQNAAHPSECDPP
jgi:hypothetical protein